MKSYHKYITIILIIFNAVTPFFAISQEKKIITKERSIRKSFPVDSSSVFILYAIYGNVEVDTWDKNEVAVDMSVSSFSYNASRAQDIIDHILFEKSESNDSIILRTKINALNNDSFSIKVLPSTKKQELYIHYILHVPKKLTLCLNNSSGDITIGDYMGTLSINMSYGALHAENLTGYYNTIYIFPGKGTSNIRSINNGEIYNPNSTNFKGNLLIGYAGQVHIDGFDTIYIKKAENLIIDKQNGFLEIGAANQILGKFYASKVIIDSIFSILDLRLDSCSMSILNTGSNIRLIDVTAYNTPIYYKPDKSNNLYFTCKLKGSKINQPDFPKFLNIVTRHNSEIQSLYTGQIGNGRGLVDFDLDDCVLYFK